MPDERKSPSGGWREVYREMDADPNAEEAVAPCPDCGRACESLVADAYECPEHGIFRWSAAADRSTADESESAENGPNESEGDGRREEPSDDPHEATRERAPWTAD
ncbi:MULTISPECIES: hypothetical protein [Halorussus]|uniref:hypothetical protein n=1 Tax=Halorussus TaxID=1070314 RepID=UPI00209F0E25|nr:hypothetical protein [Halorussus vallis]USZ74303.1 hypothetical protein NGM07_12710 [Halorussus vallis]